MRRTFPYILGLCLLSPAACDRRPAAPPAAVAPVHANPSVHQLLQRMRQRLDLMHTVARVKWNAQAPILDAARERALLENVVERGQSYHLPPEVVRPFFAAQMEAAKLIQEEDFQRWQAEKRPPFPDVPDLPALRQQIDTLNIELLQTLADARPFLSNDDGQEHLERRAKERFADLPAAVRDAALRPLRRP